VLDYVTLEAAPAFVEELVRRGLVKAKQLRESWQRVSLSTARFRQLMTVLGQDNLRYAFAARDIWDDLDLLNGLIAAKVNLEANIGPEGETPLHLAILSHRPDGVRWLLEHGASTKTRDTYGRSALEWAETERQLECMKQLILAGETVESLFRHMPTLPDKLRLLKSRWMVQFADLADFLRSQGTNVNV
jgi:hypothetical protein